MNSNERKDAEQKSTVSSEVKKLHKKEFLIVMSDIGLLVQAGVL